MKSRHFRRYSGAYIRGALYAAIAFLTAFVAEFQPLSEKSIEQLAALGLIHWSLVWGKILLATAVTMRAFFDGTIERAAAEPEQPEPAEPKAPPFRAPVVVPPPPSSAT